VIAYVVNFFLHSTALQLTISVIGVFVFVGLTAFDTQRIKAIYVEGEDDLSAAQAALVDPYTASPIANLVCVFGPIASMTRASRYLRSSPGELLGRTTQACRFGLWC
jgi:hypothetical protein